MAVGEVSFRDAMLAGDSLVAYLVLDNTRQDHLERNHYEESFHLTHLYHVGGEVVGITQKQHLTHVHGQGIRQQCGFFYTSYGIYGVLNNFDLQNAMIGDMTLSGNILSDTTYKTYRFIPRRDKMKIWDSAEDTSNVVIAEAIREGGIFSILLERQDGSLQLSPVEMPYYFPDRDLAQFQTKMEFFPADILNVENTRRVLSADDLPLGRNRKAAQGIVFNRVESTYASAFTDGGFYEMSDIVGGTTKRYRRMVVFKTLVSA